MAPRPALARLDERPLSSDWHPDELITFAEAAALHFPKGPLTASTLHLAYRRGELKAKRIAGKHFTTIADIRLMLQTDTILGR